MSKFPHIKEGEIVGIIGRYELIAAESSSINDELSNEMLLSSTFIGSVTSKDVESIAAVEGWLETTTLEDLGFQNLIYYDSYYDALNAFMNSFKVPDCFLLHRFLERC
jgi:hypothetical protein